MGSRRDARMDGRLCPTSEPGPEVSFFSLETIYLEIPVYLGYEPDEFVDGCARTTRTTKSAFCGKKEPGGEHLPLRKQSPTFMQR